MRKNDPVGSYRHPDRQFDSPKTNDLSYDSGDDCPDGEDMNYMKPYKTYTVHELSYWSDGSTGNFRVEAHDGMLRIYVCPAGYITVEALEQMLEKVKLLEEDKGQGGE